MAAVEQSNQGVVAAVEAALRQAADALRATQESAARLAEVAGPPVAATGELTDLLDDLADSRIAGIDTIRTGILQLAQARLTTDQTQTALAVIAGNDGLDLLTALTLLVGHLTSDTNPALRTLPDDTQKEIQQLGEQHIRDTADYAPRRSVTEAIALIDQP